MTLETQPNKPSAEALAGLIWDIRVVLGIDGTDADTFAALTKLVNEWSAQKKALVKILEALDFHQLNGDLDTNVDVIVSLIERRARDARIAIGEKTRMDSQIKDLDREVHVIGDAVGVHNYGWVKKPEHTVSVGRDELVDHILDRIAATTTA